MSRIACLALVIVTTALSAAAQDVYNSTPDWISSDSGHGTGAALVDLDRDGWLDLVVANGNDINQQRIGVYYNQGDGTFTAVPNWFSSDFVYNGHLDVADVNSDGYPDVAVATLGTGSTFGPVARLYLNNFGTLSSTPDWEADLVGNAFGVAFGDMNNDGHADLAVATGWAYTPVHSYTNRVYLSDGATLDFAPSWQSTDVDHLQGVSWCDVDQDGWLDLVGAASAAATRVYRNLGGTLETNASWTSTDATDQDAIMVTTGDVTGDGLPDLIVADNNQLGGGTGRFRLYNGQPGQLFETTASWTFFEGYCSAVALADLNRDGGPDLATGGWWDPLRLYFNDNGTYDWPDWATNQSSVIEKIVFGDLENDALREHDVVLATGPTSARLFYLPTRPVQFVDAVLHDGLPLDPSLYHVNRELGWVTVGFDVTGTLSIQYVDSIRPDVAISNWDSSLGNFVYYNQLPIAGDMNCDGVVTAADIDPFVQALTAGPAAYATAFPHCRHLNADTNGDGLVSAADIDPFVQLLTTRE
jgi:hypothetical protein